MGQLRIIGGAWKRTPIQVFDREGLRPTPDRVRETLFNWLGQNLQGWRCLDLFAGSGALGFEAGSRGAEQVVFVEPESKSASAIAGLIEKLNAQDRLVLVKEKAQDYLSPAADRRRLLAPAMTDTQRHCEAPQAPKQSAPFDLIFLDPPFGKGLIEAVMPQALPLLAANGCVYIESNQALRPEQAGLWGLDLVRQDKAGGVHYHLLKKRNTTQGDADVESSLSGDI
jgi:16S rRNA (guanine966-N2)-methyltransferase